MRSLSAFSGRDCTSSCLPKFFSGLTRIAWIFSQEAAFGISVERDIYLAMDLSYVYNGKEFHLVILIYYFS